MVNAIGIAIASLRKVPMIPALQVATWIFDCGTLAHREAIEEMVLMVSVTLLWNFNMVQISVSRTIPQALGVIVLNLLLHLLKTGKVSI